MKKINGIVLSALVMILALSAPCAAAADKIGFVDFQKVMLTCNAGKKAAEEYKQLFDKHKAAIQSSERELKGLQDELEKGRSTLKEDALQEKELAYQRKAREYELLVKDSNEELQNKDKELSGKLLPEIMKVVKSMGEKEKYTLILNLNAIPLAYHAAEDDLTMRVVEEFDRTYEPAQ
ncbi:MAG: OmpH family outer membrane protein [Deltaproteobacteria bacterium]|nr:OmpH family outer membrane protein [Deltaproteobacteria bacterium]